MAYEEQEYVDGWETYSTWIDDIRDDDGFIARKYDESDKFQQNYWDVAHILRDSSYSGMMRESEEKLILFIKIKILNVIINFVIKNPSTNLTR